MVKLIRLYKNSTDTDGPDGSYYYNPDHIVSIKPFYYEKTKTWTHEIKLTDESTMQGTSLTPTDMVAEILEGTFDKVLLDDCRVKDKKIAELESEVQTFKAKLYDTQKSHEEMSDRLILAEMELSGRKV